MLNGRIAPRRKALSALLISFLLVLVIPLAGLGVSYSYTNSAYIILKLHKSFFPLINFLIDQKHYQLITSPDIQ